MSVIMAFDFYLMQKVQCMRCIESQVAWEEMMKMVDLHMNAKHPHKRILNFNNATLFI